MRVFCFFVVIIRIRLDHLNTEKKELGDWKRSKVVLIKRKISENLKTYMKGYI